MTSYATHTATTVEDPGNIHDIDKLIKKFSYSIKQQEKQERNKIKLEDEEQHNKRDEFSLSEEASTTTTNKYTPLANNQRSVHSAAALLLLSNNNIIKKNKSNNLNSTITNCYISTSSNRSSHATKHNLIESVEASSNDKAIFFTTLKSLFAIFDPEQKGSIDLNELNSLGANKNEILSDVINYLFNKEEEDALNYYNSASNTNYNLNNHNLSRSSSTTNSNCSSRSSSANSTHNNNNKHSFRIKTDSSEANTTSSRLTFIKNNFKLNKKEIRSPSANQINRNKKLKQINSVKPYYVSFEEFAQAAEIILDKRKLEKLKMYQQQQIAKKNYDQYATVVTVQPPPPITAPNRANQRPTSLSTTFISTNNKTNYTTLPISSNLNGATLSQAFENVTNKTKQLNPAEYNMSLLKNANSCDLGNLIDKEEFLLKQGLNDIDSIRQWYLFQLKENKLKQQNIHKLKHQNLFSIDKMLTDLKHLNDLNSTMRSFLTTNEQEFDSLDMDLSITTSNSSSTNSQKENFFLNQQTLAAAASAAAAAITTSPTGSGVFAQPSLPSYKEYLEQFELNKTDSELDAYLKEKQERIDNLQKEKSFLIRRLFEMKSEAANLTNKPSIPSSASNNSLSGAQRNVNYAAPPFQQSNDSNYMRNYQKH